MAVVEAGQQQILQILDMMQPREEQILITLQKQEEQYRVLMQKMQQLCELNVRHFTRQWNLEMRKMEAECPSTFVILPESQTAFKPKNWISRSYKLHLLCQYPSGPHRLDERYAYDLTQSKEWWASVAPWLKHVITFLKYGVPVAGALGAVVDAVDFKNFEAEIDLLEKVTEDLPEIVEGDAGSFERRYAHDGREETMIGPALRAVYGFLKEKDKAQFWGGLQKVVTPDGNILWLCGLHAHPYESPVLKIEE
jgi:hypothetical protein